MYSYDKTTSSVVGSEYTDSDGTKKNYTYIFESFANVYEPTNVNKSVVESYRGPYTDVYCAVGTDS